MFDRVEQLQENVLDGFVLAKIPVLVEDLIQEVAAFAIVHNDICEIFALDNTMEGNDIGMSGRELVEVDLLQMQLALTR